MDGSLKKPIRREQLNETARGTNVEQTEDFPTAWGRAAKDESVWNREELLMRIDDDRELLGELLQIFCQESQRDLEAARSELAEGNFEALTLTAHTLKGMLRNLAMHRAGGIAYALELAARQEKRKQAEELLTQLDRALAEVLVEVHAHPAEV